MNKIILKKAIMSDFEEVAALERGANSKTYYGLTDEKELKDFIKNEQVFLIKEKNIVLGLVAYRITKKNIPHINGLIIKPNFRGRGIAKEAMIIILKKIAKYPQIELEVHPRNTSAVRLYLALGFVIEAWKDNCFGDGEPRLKLAISKK